MRRKFLMGGRIQIAGGSLCTGLAMTLFFTRSAADDGRVGENPAPTDNMGAFAADGKGCLYDRAAG